jgi:cysteine desulfurase
VKLPIYMDNHATTPVDPRVLEAMLPYLTEKFGNPASRNHSYGWETEQAVETARRQVASLIGADSNEIVFTSGATESDNLAIKGAVEANKDKGDHIVTCAIEHKAVLDSCKRLVQSGIRVTYLPVGSEGFFDLADLERALTPKTILVSIMAANNEVGVLHPISEIGALCRAHSKKNGGILFHTDAAQGAGKIPMNVGDMNIDLLSIAGHKLYAPKGVGALYVRKSAEVKISALQDGGGHEHGMRSGTLNVPGIVALGKACELAQQELKQEMQRLAALRNRLRDKLLAGVGELHINGPSDWSRRLPGNLNVSFPGVDGEALMMGIGGDVAVSSGAACSSAKMESSFVLRALGLSEDLAGSSIRFGLGRFNTEDEVDHVAARIGQVVAQLRELSPAAD